MNAQAISLRRRIVTAYLATIAITCVLFGFFGFLIAYSVEDSLFEDTLRDEIAFQQAHWQRIARSATPRATISRSIERQRNSRPTSAPHSNAPQQSEYSGTEGRHYHLARFALPRGDGPAFAVAEVSRHLVVRPVRSEILRFLGGWSLAIVVVAGSIGYWLATRATAPLTSLAATLADGQRGEIPYVAGADFPDNEIGTLARSLERAFNRIRAFVERESAFTRDVSHELRTPLAVIRSSAELVEARHELAPSAKRAVQRIATAARDMERTIDLLLALAREERADNKQERLALLPLVESALLDASDRFDGSAYRVQISVPAGLVIIANPTGLSLILANLIGNVFQHARDGHLTIAFDDARLSIIDDGPGISDEVIAAEGQVFVKSHASTGHGLGLDIVRRLCEREDISFEIETSKLGGTAVHLGFLLHRS